MYIYGNRIYRNKYHYPKQHRVLTFNEDKVVRYVQIAALVAEFAALFAAFLFIFWYM